MGSLRHRGFDLKEYRIVVGYGVCEDSSREFGDETEIVIMLSVIVATPSVTHVGMFTKERILKVIVY